MNFSSLSQSWCPWFISLKISEASGFGWMQLELRGLELQDRSILWEFYGICSARHRVWLGIFDWDMGMDQYLLIPFLVGWTSIYQLFWCSPGVQGFDTLPFDEISWITKSVGFLWIFFWDVCGIMDGMYWTIMADFTGISPRMDDVCNEDIWWDTMEYNRLNRDLIKINDYGEINNFYGI